ncbi:MAG: hypothetical protein J1E33_06550 [Alistipes sp.]|nr:hypothetical protein [Alistipes sp.]
MFFTGEIKSKVNARQFAVEQANTMFAKVGVSDESKLIELAEKIEAFVVGKAELPEFVTPQNEFAEIASLFAATKSKIADEKPEGDSAELAN